MKTRTLERINWSCALVMVIITIFETGKVDVITFTWMPIFLMGVYGLPLYLHSWDRRLMFEIDLLRRRRLL